MKKELDDSDSRQAPNEAHLKKKFNEKTELKVLSGIAMQSVVEDLGPKFERARYHV
jgi:hypothetical protein